ncbi:MAG: ABC transporter permease [Treponema sp.]|jgi:lipoprotein-releasing system permease protein|nr:ABC transporter permease [Treponema sp.]
MFKWIRNAMTNAPQPRRAEWIHFVASRYVARGQRRSPSTVLAILGIAIGVMALIVIIAVMNGFQMGFIESILEISSYHIRADNAPVDDAERSALETRLADVSGVNAVVPFREFHGLLRGTQRGQQVAVIRGVPPDVLQRDSAMKRKLDLERGAFNLTDNRSILLGAELARRLGVHTGDEVTLLSVAGLFPGEAEAADSAFTVVGMFRSGFYEYDLGWGFVNLDAAKELGGPSISLGVKLKNRWQDSYTLSLMQAMPETSGLALNSWRSYNRAFFSALRTEKLLMFVLLGLIFIVVGLNIFQAQRRAVLERREEIGLLRAIGAGEHAVRLIFVWDGLFIGLVGAGSGLALGLLIAFNIGRVFSALETIVNGLTGALNAVVGLVTGSGSAAGADFAIFSPTVFYIKEIPSRLIFHEVLLIFLFGFLSALAAAWAASGKVSQTKPAEVLRYE